MMTCTECGTQMKTKRENYKYDASGLPGITLAGIDVSRCPKCGEVEVTIPNIEGLHKALAGGLIRKKERLAPQEIRFLRKFLGLSGSDFAETMGVKSETVSRWELGRQSMGPTADRLLRWLALTREPVSEYPLSMMRNIATEEPRLMRIEMRSGEGGWQMIRGLVGQPA
jgi:putative zinc finger/helix-turn-helix YgiT family protein